MLPVSTEVHAHIPAVTQCKVPCSNIVQNNIRPHDLLSNSAVPRYKKKSSKYDNMKKVQNITKQSLQLVPYFQTGAGGLEIISHFVVAPLKQQVY